MTKCERFEKCITFFKEQSKKLPATIHFLESTYCNVDNHRCARLAFFMALDSEDIPLDLFPCQQIRGQLLARQAKSS